MGRVFTNKEVFGDLKEMGVKGMKWGEKKGGGQGTAADRDAAKLTLHNPAGTGSWSRKARPTAMVAKRTKQFHGYVTTGKALASGRGGSLGRAAKLFRLAAAASKSAGIWTRRGKTK